MSNAEENCRFKQVHVVAPNALTAAIALSLLLSAHVYAGEDLEIIYKRLRDAGNSAGRSHNLARAEKLKLRELEFVKTNFPNSLLRELEIMNYLGEIYIEEKKFAEAEAIFKQAIPLTDTMDPNARIWLPVLAGNLGVACLNNNDLAQAEHYSKQAVEYFDKYENPQGSAVSMSNLALVLARQKRGSEAIQTANKSIEKMMQRVGFPHKSIAPLLYRLGLVYEELGDYDNAIASFNKALAMRTNPDPDRPRIKESTIKAALKHAEQKKTLKQLKP